MHESSPPQGGLLLDVIPFQLWKTERHVKYTCINAKINYLLKTQKVAKKSNPCNFFENK